MSDMHLDIPTHTDVDRIAHARHPHSATIYLTTSLQPWDIDANRLAARALFDKATERVRDTASRRDAEAFAAHLTDLLDDFEFWQDLGRSLAIFLTPDSIIEFRLPSELTDSVDVADRFTITPLLRALTFPNAALVLAISQNAVRLIEVSASLAAQEVAVPTLPEDAADAVGRPSIGGRSPYGRTQGDEGVKMRLTQYARAVDHAIRPVLNGQSLPLILAASAPLESIFRHLSGYAHVAEEPIPGNPDELSEAELADAARGVLDRLYANELLELRELFAERRSQGRAATDLSDLARAAAFGAVDTLVLDMDGKVPGTVRDDGTMELDEHSDLDVLEEIARRALAAGARVMAVRREDMPEDVQAAGILRYIV